LPPERNPSVRVGKELPRQTALTARQRGVSLDAFVAEDLRETSRRKPPESVALGVRSCRVPVAARRTGQRSVGR
jgi:hypothetical protein